MNFNEIKRTMKRVLYYTLGLLIFIFVLTVLFFYNINYSEGYRAGIVIKMSNKGYIFKTAEGQLDVEGLNASGKGTMSSVWNFSVDKDNEELIKKLNEVSLSKERVQLKYEEKYAQLFWRGDTKYFITDVIEQQVKASEPKPEIKEENKEVEESIDQ